MGAIIGQRAAGFAVDPGPGGQGFGGVIRPFQQLCDLLAVVVSKLVWVALQSPRGTQRSIQIATR